MNIRDLLAQSLASLARSHGRSESQIALLPSPSLGQIHLAPETLQQAFSLLVRGAVSLPQRGSLEIQAERFTDDLTNQDWVEISLLSYCAIPVVRLMQVSQILQRAGGRLDWEAVAGNGPCCVYRIYAPCTRVVVPFPARHPGLAGAASLSDRLR